MGITAERLDKLGLVDEVLREPLGGAHRDPQEMADSLKAALIRHLEGIEQLSEDELLAQRYARLRGQGVYHATG
jgi:acetyl-CoA carboxylase carboxyl transferase subunit alpha